MNRSLSKISDDEQKSSKGFRMFPKVSYDDPTFFHIYRRISEVFPRLPLHNSFIALLGSFQRFLS